MSDNDPTPDEVERAKKWAAMQTPPVTLERRDRHCWMVKGDNVVIAAVWPYHLSPDAAWSALALVLRPYFASVAPVVREECAVEAKRVLEADLQFRPSSGMIASGIATVGEEMVNAIRAMK